jgi:tRNA threonylcarbamoyl adenosine modification protein (Sua5/YciO/YrdC/YwlC family)
MKILQLPDVLKDNKIRREIEVGILEGKIFLYPTDTVYGIGCDASNSSAVKRIRIIKTSDHPFSVIAPSKAWIKKNLIVTRPGYLKKLPGPYTLIFKMKNKVVCDEVAIRSLGVRIPRNPFTKIVQKTGIPFVTTSANMSGETPVWSTYGVPNGIERHIDIAVHHDILNNPPSKVIDLTSKKPRVLR